MSTDNKTIWIISGESSGDLYGARLAEHLFSLDKSLSIKGMGGECMKTAGVEILVDSTELGIVGFVEVFKHIFMFLGIFKSLVERAEKERPDAVLLIDYPGFNVRLAKKLHKQGIKVIYYITPQVWAWGKKRIPIIAENVDKMLVIFPFEKEIYAETGLDTEFIGHPLMEILEEKKDLQIKRDDNLILLLPGSRHSEIDRLLIPIINTSKILYKENNNLHFVLQTPRKSIKQYIEEKLKTMNMDSIPLEIVVEKNEYWMQKASAGLAASGTVTVQCAILGLPLVVVYRLNPLSYFLSRLLVKIKFFTMVNLVTEREVFEEFLQGRVKPKLLAEATKKILPEGDRREEVLKGIKEMCEKLGHDR
ncbi:MAG: lipid-A-disaccharide synthase, partial [Verrucomicrobiota bacterium]|nr:lipid-A-disaccharide synthase [Verrucomicrobiota bacterium]